MSTLLVTAAIAQSLTILDAPEVLVEDGRETPQLRAWVAAARSGDQEAFASLVTMHQRIVFRTALAALGSREDAEDAAQDAFVVAWKKLDGFRGESTFKTWLLTIVWRKALDRRRTRRSWWRRTERPADTAAADPFEHIASVAPDPERITIARGASDDVRRAIARLSPKLRDTLVLAATGEHSYGDIASMLGVPLGTVKWRVAEARRLVKDQIDD